MLLRQGMRIGSNQMLLNFGRTRSLAYPSTKSEIAGHRRREESLQRIGEPDLGIHPSGVLRLIPNPPKRCTLELTPGLMGKGGRTGQARFQ